MNTSHLNSEDLVLPESQNTASEDASTIILTEGLSKKYCRKLHKSLRYGMVDLVRESLGFPPYLEMRPDEFHAVHDVSFRVAKGDCVAVLGPNGAGKTTLLKLMNGLLKPTQGRIRMRGRVVALTQLGAGFNAILSGRENIIINAAVLGFSTQQTQEIIDEIIEFSEIEDAIDDPVKTYSSGMRARLGFSIAAFVRPDILLMDEVQATGDRGFRLKCFEHIEYLCKKGTSVVVVSHALGPLTRFCNRAIVLEHGKLVFDGSIKAGIEKYQDILEIRQIDANQPDDDDAFPETKSTQGAEAWVESIELLDEDSQPIESAEHGQRIRLRIDVRSMSNLQDFGVVAVINNETGVVATMKKHGERIFEENASEAKIDLIFPELDLLRGVYFVIIRVIGKDINDHKHERQFVLKVTTGKRQGVMRLDHKWKLVDA